MAGSFNTQPPEGGWVVLLDRGTVVEGVSTHSRPKAAGRVNYFPSCGKCVSTHSRPKAAGFLNLRLLILIKFQHTAARRRLAGRLGRFSAASSVSTHSRPKAAGIDWILSKTSRISFNTQPPEGGWICTANSNNHTWVSTHSRPKAAGLFPIGLFLFPCCFNTQPPEGGWWSSFILVVAYMCFNTQPPEGGWPARL